MFDKLKKMLTEVVKKSKKIYNYLFSDSNDMENKSNKSGFFTRLLGVFKGQTKISNYFEQNRVIDNIKVQQGKTKNSTRLVNKKRVPQQRIKIKKVKKTHNQNGTQFGNSSRKNDKFSNNQNKNTKEKEEDIVQGMLEYFEGNKLKSEAQLYDNLEKILYKEIDVIAKKLNLPKDGKLKDGEDIKNVELRFYRKADSKTIGSYNRNSHGVPQISLNKSNFTSKLRSDTPEERKEAYVGILKTLYHEVSHYYDDIAQNELADMGSEDLMTVAGDLVLVNYEKFKYNSGSIDEKNYNNMYIEAKANEYAYERLIDILGNNKQFDIMKKGYETLKVIGEYKRDKKGKMVPREETVRDTVQNILANPARYHSSYERLVNNGGDILRKEYDIEGERRRTPSEVVLSRESDLEKIQSNPDMKPQEKKEHIEKIQKMYYGILYRALNEADESTVEQFVREQGQKNIDKLYDEIDKYYKRKRNEKLSATVDWEKILAEAKEERIEFPKEFKEARYSKENRQKRINEYYDEVSENIQKLKDQADRLCSKKQGQNIPTHSLCDMEEQEKKEGLNTDVDEIINIAEENENLEQKVQGGKELLESYEELQPKEKQESQEK